MIPGFDDPIKLAGKLSMLDNLSHGRLDVGFARAFLPDEFAAFQTSMDESRPRFEEDPDRVCRQVGTLRERYGHVELSLQVNFGNMPLEDGMRTVELFGREVLPRFA